MSSRSSFAGERDLEKDVWPSSDLHRYNTTTSIEQFDAQPSAFAPRPVTVIAPRDSDRDTIADAYSVKGPSSPRSIATSASAILELDDTLRKHGLLRKPDGEIGWDFDSPECVHPRNWTISRKMWDFALICLVEAFVLGMSSVGAPVSELAEEGMGISSLMGNFVFTST